MTSFLVDQQLPKALATFLSERGHDARHIKEYDGGPTMPDPDIARLADFEDRFVVTKDDDFRITHLLGKPPARLLQVTCGNISTRDLLVLFDQQWSALDAVLAAYEYVEINPRACSSTTATDPGLAGGRGQNSSSSSATFLTLRSSLLPPVSHAKPSSSRPSIPIRSPLTFASYTPSEWTCSASWSGGASRNGLRRPRP